MRDFQQTKSHILIVGNINKENIKRIKEIFISFDADLSLKIETPDDFLKNKNKPLYQSIFKEHIVIYGETKFIGFYSKDEKI